MEALRRLAAEMMAIVATEGTPIPFREIKRAFWAPIAVIEGAVEIVIIDIRSRRDLGPTAIRITVIDAAA
jgi:hypothetical protein